MAETQWQVHAERVALDHPYVRVIMQTVELPDGRIIPDWPIVYLKDYINVIVVNQDNQIMILEGYKHGVGRSSWQVVGGYIEAGEDPLETAKRELMEETGYASDDWEHLGSFIVDANRRASEGHFFLARHARQVARPDHDDLEAFAVKWVSSAEAEAALHAGRFAVMGYAAPLALALLKLKAA